MHKKDKIKTLIATSLLVIIISTLLIFGKESVLMKYISGGALIIWLASMFFLNKKN